MAKVKADDLLKAMTDIDDNLLEEAEPGRKPAVIGLGSIRRPMAAVLALMLGLGGIYAASRYMGDQAKSTEAYSINGTDAAAGDEDMSKNDGVGKNSQKGNSSKGSSSENSGSTSDGTPSHGSLLLPDGKVDEGSMEDNMELTNLIEPTGALAISQKDYPESVKMPNWEDYLEKDGSMSSESQAKYQADFEAWRTQYEERSGKSIDSDEYLQTLAEFVKSTAGAVLSSGEENQNAVYSPANVYIALAMLSEVTDGASRAQLLNLLGQSALENLEDETGELWSSNYVDDGVVTSLLANSIWMRDDLSYNEETLNKLSEIYYASSYSGDVENPDYTKDLQSWINSHTGNLLKDQAEGQEFTAETILKLVSTIYYTASWDEVFEEYQNEDKTFTNADGTETVTAFMNQSGTETYYQGEHYTAVAKDISYSGKMWLILPEEGTDPEELLSDEGCLNMICGLSDASVSERNVIVNLSVPKFDVVSDLDLCDVLKSLGVTDIFLPGLADFNPLYGDDVDESLKNSTYVSEIEHAARVRIYEEGLEGAAYTAISLEKATAFMDGEEVDMVLDRPFLFAITGSDGSVLFMGVVNTME